MQVLPAPRGYRVRTSQSRARRGGYAPLAAPALSSTRQAQILNTAIVAAPTGVEGIIIGRDKLSNTLVSHDPFTAYENGEIGSPNVVTLGSISAGKSSLLKTVYVLRPLILKQRRVVVMDKKDRGGEGEYAEVARTFGAEPLRFVVGEGGVRLNIFDPMVLAGPESTGRRGYWPRSPSWPTTTSRWTRARNYPPWRRLIWPHCVTPSRRAVLRTWKTSYRSWVASITRTSPTTPRR